MIYHRGTVGAFNAWAERVGDDSYRWDNYFKFFKRSIDFTPASVNAPLRAANSTATYNASAYSTSGGPLQLSFPNWVNPASSYFPAAFESALDLPKIAGFDSGVLEGHAYTKYTFDPNTGLRSSSETSFLGSALRNASAQRRANIQVYTLSQAHKILFDQNKTATGVMVNAMGANFTLSARKEVVLSAGAWHSPQLLMLSGVGPRATLQAHDIPVVADRPGSLTLLRFDDRDKPSQRHLTLMLTRLSCRCRPKYLGHDKCRWCDIRGQRAHRSSTQHCSWYGKPGRPVQPEPYWLPCYERRRLHCVVQIHARHHRELLPSDTRPHCQLPQRLARS